MNIGYARVSTSDQKLDLQLDALKSAGCDYIFQDVASGAKNDREGLIQALAFAKPGDTLVTFKLDRVARSLRHLIDVINELSTRDISFSCLRESIDTKSSGGKLVFHIFASLAEFERDLIRERTMAGLEAARARGRIGGRPLALDAKSQDNLLLASQNRSRTIDQICSDFQISRSTYFRYTKSKSCRNKKRWKMNGET